MTAKPTDDSLLHAGRTALLQEASALDVLANNLDAVVFPQICRAVLDNKGRVFLMGVGKSGHIAAKIAATLCSTGTAAQFIHPTEAAHGDLGAIAAEDLVILLSKSGNSSEIAALIPVLQGRGNRLICLTCEPDSPLAQACDLALVIAVEQEACPINLAPTTSTTLMLALGDALAVAVLHARGFSKEDFARSHPSGSLGRRLLIRVRNLMHTGKELPLVSPTDTIAEALLTVSGKGLGVAIVVAKDKALGVLTDGDVRRCLGKNLDIHSTPISQVMTKDFQHIDPNSFAADAFHRMQESHITMLPVLEAGRLIGAITLHATIQAGVA